MSSQAPKSSPILAMLPGLYLVAALYFDSVCPLGLLTPFFVVIGLMTMALVFRPGIMIPWAVIYTAVVCAIFLSPTLFVFFSGHPYYTQYVIPSVRAGTYVVVGGISCYLSVVLSRVRKSESELNHILENLPFPILKSDHNGSILYWNAPVEALIPELKTHKYGGNYFDLLATPEAHGRTVMEYLKCFARNNSTRPPLQLSIKGIPYKGYVRLLDWSGKVYLLTILEKVGEQGFSKTGDA